MDAAIIEKEAMRLSESQRALLANRLLESISHTSPQLREAWVQEANDRMMAFEKGEISAVDGPEAMNKLRSRYKR